MKSTILNLLTASSLAISLFTAKDVTPTVTPLPTIQVDKEDTKETIRYVKVTTKYLNVRKKANVHSRIIDGVAKGDILKITHRTSTGWGKVSTGGYINLKHTKELSKKKSERIERLKKRSGVKPPSYKRVTPVSQSKYNFTKYELDLFARLVRAESEDEPYAGQVAVASVVLNRLDSKEFPDSIKEVIYQEKQFSPAMYGTINKKATASAKRAVQDAINGKGRLYEPMYFYAPKYVKSPFMETLETVTVIGGHVFKK